MPDIRWWCSLPGAEAKATLGTVPMGLYDTLDHYFPHPIKLPPPSHPVLPYPTMSPSPHSFRQSPPPPSNSYHSAPPNPSPLFLYHMFPILPPPPPLRLRLASRLPDTIGDSEPSLAACPTASQLTKIYLVTIFVNFYLVT